LLAFIIRIYHDVRSSEYQILIELCRYRVTLYDNVHVDIRHKKCTTRTLAKLQIFKIHTQSCFYEASKCYSIGTYTLKGQGCDKFYTEQAGITNSMIKVFHINIVMAYKGSRGTAPL